MSNGLAETTFATPDPNVEALTRELGGDLLRRIGRGPRPWNKAWWYDSLMALTSRDPATKVQLFRFIDALPSLRTDHAVRQHLDEYLDEAGDIVPWLIRLPLWVFPRSSGGDAIVSHLARFGSTQMAHRFIAGSNPTEALATVRSLRRSGLAFTADLLGEAVISEHEAEAYQRQCLDLLNGLSGPLNADREVAIIDRDDQGPIPRVNLSLKLTSLTTWFDPIHAEATTRKVLERLRPILRTARELGAFVNVDMEQYAYKDLTYAIFKSVLLEPEFRDWRHVGIVCQAYLPEALDDLESLRDWAKARGVPVTIRLVKGAYWDYEVLHARQLGWPIPVFTEKWRSDENYERCSRFLLENHEHLRPAFGSHNVRSLAHGLALAESLGVRPGVVETQVLHGMGERIAHALRSNGYRVRVYTPYGELLPGMAYLVRRLLENTSNDSFVKVSSAADVSLDELLRNPSETGAMFGRYRRSKPAANELGPLAPFENEPPTDFSKVENREAMRAALDAVRARTWTAGSPPKPASGQQPLICAPIVDGETHQTGRAAIESLDPSDTNRVLALTEYGDRSLAERAVASARNAWPNWAATPVRDRAEVLVQAAAIMRKRRLELAAWQILECGKPWREADADIAEAIDFCEFYARDMIRLGEEVERDVSGETNRIEHIPRGVVVVIPPWNFPLAIPCGMTAAALVAGNCVILKPAEQSPIMGWFLAQILNEAGVPPGVLNYLPGRGEEVGAALVNHPDVDLIAFTGSRAVGLLINRQAAETPAGQAHVKRVIAEMGGKNAIIIDDDADLDEAVVGTIHSAFGYAGQKCSACSRAIVLDGVYDAFLNRLAEAAKAVVVGAAEDPETIVGPVIDADAKTRVLEYQRIATNEGRVAFQGDIRPLVDKGHYVVPMIVADVAPEARIAREEIFGPILAVMRVKDLDEALRVANGVEYALTGGIYSRSPANIDRVRRDFRVGNLYINRPITGALVNRQPFGGFKLSGIGTKAGGNDYLKEFLLTRVVTENTMRRGFSPDLEAELQAAKA